VLVLIRLGSNSQTRANILKENNIKFVQTGSNFDEEQIIEKNPNNFVIKATKGKYKDIFNNFGLDIPILVADTVVCTDDKILRKAISKENARDILLSQSNNYVKIITYMIYSTNGIYFEDLSTTIYNFNKFDNDDIENYLNTNLWQDKAGACMVEGFCKKYIKSQIGLTSTAMGLSIEKLESYLKIK
jgi:septum formation protein